MSCIPERPSSREGAGCLRFAHSIVPRLRPSPLPGARPAAPRTPRARAGFTLLELLVVIAVIAILASIGIPTWLHMQKKADVDSTRTLVNAVATAIESYSQHQWTVSTPIASTNPVRYKQRVYRIFDVNGDGYIDGAPGSTSSLAADKPKLDMGDVATAKNGGASQNLPFDQTILDSGYTGFIVMTQPPIPKRNVNAKKQVVDAWKWPLHIAFASDVYGPSGFGVWSDGPDGKPNTKDDITSWDSGQHED